MSIITSPEETRGQPTGLSSGGVPGRNGHHYKSFTANAIQGRCQSSCETPLHPNEERAKQICPEDHLRVFGPYSA